MVHISHDCPYDGCRTQKAGFHSIGCAPVANTDHYIALFQCNICGNGVVFRFKGGVYVQQWLSNGQRSGPVVPIGTWPSPNENKVPNDVPQNVAEYFLQARGSAQRGFWDAAGAMFRKALDVSLRTLNPGAKGTIYERIESLPEGAGVTKAMKDWAHAVRRLGADAAHDEDPFTKEETEDLEYFTDAFLTYAFSLPALVRSHQKPDGGNP